MMGYSYRDLPRRGLNSVHRLALGMRSGNVIDAAPGFSGVISLFSLHARDEDGAPLTKVAAIAIGVTGASLNPNLNLAMGNVYYVAFRANVANSYEDQLNGDLGGVNGPNYNHVIEVHSEMPEKARSFLHAVLRTVGSKFKLPGSNTEISLASIDSENNSAKISIISGPVCGNGIVENSESCDGGPCCDSLCRFRSSSSVCRAAVSSCDLQEMCSGSSSSCPANAFAPAGTLCRNASSSNPCDVADFCTDLGLCPNSYAADGAVCNLNGCETPASGNCIGRTCVGTCATSSSSNSDSSSQSTLLGSSSLSTVTSALLTSAPAFGVCGDGMCGRGEDCKSCPSDCRKGVQYCCSYSGCAGRACPESAEAVASLCKISLSSLSSLPCLFGQCQ